jgi:hypothetical protein
LGLVAPRLSFQDDQLAKKLADTDRLDSLSSRFRARRDVFLRSLISEVSDEKGQISILDLGGSIEYWHRVGLDFLREKKAHVTVLNYVASELKADDYDSALFTPSVGDACELSRYGDGAFDLVHSNSVIEHVGPWSRMKQFAGEARRVGRNYYVQTPYFWFPVDPHFYRFPLFHWLPPPLQATLLNRLPLAHVGRIDSINSAFEALDGTRLLDERQIRIAFPDAKLVRERVLGLTKSLIAVRHV